MEDEINLSEYIKVIAKRKWLIVFFVIVGASIMFVQTLLAPKLFKSEVTFLSMSSSSGNLSQAFSAFGVGGGVVDGANVDLILKSRTLSGMVAQNDDIKKIVFEKLWDSQNNRWVGKEPTLDQTASAVFGGIKTANQTKIEVVWENPEVAASIANAYAIELIRFLNQKSIGVNLQILDEAVSNHVPFNKKSNLNAILGGFVGLFFGIFFVFLMEYWTKIKASL